MGKPAILPSTPWRKSIVTGNQLLHHAWIILFPSLRVWGGINESVIVLDKSRSHEMLNMGIDCADETDRLDPEKRDDCHRAMQRRKARDKVVPGLSWRVFIRYPVRLFGSLIREVMWPRGLATKLSTIVLFTVIFREDPQFYWWISKLSAILLLSLGRILSSVDELANCPLLFCSLLSLGRLLSSVDELANR